MERNGYFQGHQGYPAHQENAPRRRFKRSSEIRLWKHLLLIWGGGLIVWPLLIAVLGYSFLPHGEAFVFTLMVFALNLFTGWIPAILIWLFNKGIRGWIEGIKMMRQAATEPDYAEPMPADVVPGQAAEVEAPALTDEQVAQQWAAMNPYGCCMDHRDADGYPSHGGADCQHPQVQS